ncbi:MAG: zinc-dependent metalloprotease [Acidimicrobiales bacterium]|nr:zinc-dependent metalloprotease [Acidimicrobiales bacterium]
MSDHPSDDPFGNIPFLGDLARILGQQAGGGWEAAKQVAVSLATGGSVEPNVDPIERIAVEELARVAELRVADATELTLARSGRLVILPVNRSEWARRTLDDYRPLFDGLSDALSGGLTSSGAAPEDSASSDPTMAMFEHLMRAMSPMVLGVMAGSLVGHLAQGALGQYDLPIPRPGGDELLLCVPNLHQLSEEWSLPTDDLRLWLAIREITTHAVMSVPHVRARLMDLLDRHARGFQSDPAALEHRLGDLGSMSSPDELQRLFADPEVLLGAIRSPEQEALEPQLHAVVAAITGYVDHIVDDIGSKLLTSHTQLTEALRRRRVEADPSDRFVERLLGLELTQAQYDRGRSFVDGVLERGGAEALARLWDSERELPTPNELDAPGLWLARIDLPLD